LIWAKDLIPEACNYTTLWAQNFGRSYVSENIQRQVSAIT
jgi:hypothetical protein